MAFVVVILILLTLAKCQVPPVDQCQYVNATEPSECPDHIGPPCPPCIINEQPDYINGDSLNISETTRDKVTLYMNENIDYWLKNYPPSMKYPTNDPSDIYQGAAGRAQIFLRLYTYTKNETQLNYAQEYIENALTNINTKNKEISYMMGNAGIYTLTSLYYHIINDNSNYNKYLNQVIDIFTDVNTAIINNDNISPKYGFSMGNLGHFTGIAGLVYNGIFLNQYFNTNIIDNSLLINMVHYLLDIGIETGNKFGHNYMMWNDGFKSGCYLVGAGEGIGGVLRNILDSYYFGYVSDIFSISKYSIAITNTLDFLLSIQYSDGNMPTYCTDTNVCAQQYGNDNDARVQWCHGAPSFQETYSKAALIYTMLNNITLAEKWLNAGLLAYNSTWNRGLLIKGLMQCHGIGGNIYTMLNLFENLQLIEKQGNNILNNKYDFNYLINESGWRAKQMIEWTLNDNNLDHTRTKYSNADFSMWWSSYGIPVLYIQVIQPNWPFIPVCMPVWNYCI